MQFVREEKKSNPNYPLLCHFLEHQDYIDVKANKAKIAIRTKHRELLKIMISLHLVQFANTCMMFSAQQAAGWTVDCSGMTDRSV